MKKLVYIPFIILGFQSGAYAQKVSNKGKDFWAAFGHHLQMEIPAWFPSDSLKLVFDFSADQQAHVVVTIDGTTYREEYDVPANSVLTSKKMPLGPNREPGTIHDPMLYTRTSNWPGGTNSEGIFKKKGIHIQSDVPIVVFERMYFSASSAATMLFPTDSWGYHYLCLSPSQSFTSAGGGTEPSAFSYFFVIASENNTKLTINPSAPSRSGLPANVPFDIVLQKGEVYQYLAGKSSSTSMHEISGTTITSASNSNGECLPFAAFVGSSATKLSWACGALPPTGASLEHVFQQIFPQQAWGKRYFTVPTSVDNDPFTRNINTFRVMVKDPATVVKRNGIALTGLTRGYYEFLTNTVDVIEADQPVQVAQILPSQLACGWVGKGDPDYMILSPVEQAITKASFMRSALQNVDCNYLTVTLPTAGLASFKIDGQLNNFTQTYPHPNYPGYSVAVRRWDVRSNTDPRPPQQCSIECDSAFNAFTYGLGQAESYMYNAGTYINNLNGYPFIKNQYNTSDTANLYACVNNKVELSVLLRYKPTKIFWELSKLADTLSPYADVTMNAPVSQGTIIVNNLPYYKYTLPGMYTFSRSGKFIIPVFATEPTVEQCNNTEEVFYEVDVRDALVTDFSLLLQNCNASETVPFIGNLKFNDSSLVQRWEWVFKNGAAMGTAQGQQVSYTFNAGANSARLVAINETGCAADTTKLFTLSDKPATPLFSAVGPANCVNNAIQFSEISPQAGVQNWFWDFGNGTRDTLLTNGYNTSKIYGQNDTFLVKHVVKYNDNCISDTATQLLVVYANPTLAMSNTAGCLPVNGQVNFSSTVTTPENQAVQSYLWNFGDSNANAGNPNTSTLANPSHIYVDGNYTVSLKATTAKGCMADSSWGISLFPRPAIQYGPVLAPVCLNTVAPVSVATATITNGTAGTGFYKGPGVDSLGNFNPALANVGNHTIKYIFNTDKGCMDSAAATIWVHAVPTALFTASDTTCLNQAVTFTNQSSIDNTVDVNTKITTWIWNFDDGKPDSIITSGLPFNKLFSTNKSHNVTLVTKSAEGCVSNSFSKTVTVNPVPIANFSLPIGICMPGGTATFTNNSSIIDQSALTYEWNFGDGTTSTDVNPTHAYATSKAYTVTLKATSALGCTTDTSFVLPASAFVNKPVASFTASNSKPCVGTGVTFTDKSTPGSNISDWDWSFGDGTKSTVQNPSKTYAIFGSYTVGLVVKNNGCLSDTAKQVVSVFANPALSISYPVGCLPENGVVGFSSTVTTPENQPVQSYLWNFGDPNANIGNPNTSVLANPSHIYSAGNYTVILKATTANGCFTDSSWGISLYPRPVLQYGPVLSPVCLNTTSPVSVATATVTNGVPGTGVYKGNGTDSQGNFNPAIANVGNHTIQYLYTTNNGCKDSATASIWVHVVPSASFTVQPDICLDQAATFTDQSTIDLSADVNAKIATWTWNFGDGGTDVVYPNGQPFNKTFTTSKTYSVTLVAKSADGCVSSTFSKNLAVHAVPVASFTLPSGICMPGGQALFTNTSAVSDQTQLSFQWSFGDGNTASTVNGSNVYTSIQPYSVSLMATSAFGCKADTTKVLPASSFISRPVVAFDVSNNKPCQGSVISFTDKSTTGGTIASWDWTFGDGTQSSLQNPTKSYTNFGSYTANLTITDNSGCSSLPGNNAKVIDVRINPQIDAGPDITAEENNAILLKATATNVSELLFSWQPAGLLNNPALLQPTYIVKQDQVFVLTATDKDGICTATDEMKVKVLRSIMVPNAFSPNGDGINDNWIIPNLADYSNAGVKVFDRYGKMVFVSQGYSKPWDGSVNGKQVPSGTYYYIIRVKQGETPLNGSVTIIR